MIQLKFSIFAFSALAFLAGASLAQAGTVVEVTLTDKGQSAEMAKDHGLGMANMSMASDMAVKLSAESVPAGKVTFKVTNASKDMQHEMLVMPYKEGMPLPYDEVKATVDEDKGGSLGEVAETDPGKSGKLTLRLKPGTYVLFCNIAGHFANGMWAKFTVK